MKQWLWNPEGRSNNRSRVRAFCKQRADILIERRRHIQIRGHIAQGAQDESPGSKPRMRHGKPLSLQTQPVEYEHVYIQRPGRPCRRAGQGIRIAASAAAASGPLDPQRKRKQRANVQAGPHRRRHIQIRRLRPGARLYVGLRFVDRRYGGHAHIPRSMQSRYAKAKMLDPFAEVRPQSKKRLMLLQRLQRQWMDQKSVSGSSKLISCIQMLR